MSQQTRTGKIRVESPLPVLFGLTLLCLPAFGVAQAAHEPASGGSTDLRTLQTPLCVPDVYTLCLNGDRFAVTAGYQQTPSGPSYMAHAVPLTADTGYFWFFDSNNVELVVKVLDACGDPFNSYWVFAAGLTNLGVGLYVTDLRYNETRTYINPLGTPFTPIQDTSAFSTCP